MKDLLPCCWDIEVALVVNYEFCFKVEGEKIYYERIAAILGQIEAEVGNALLF